MGLKVFGKKTVVNCEAVSVELDTSASIIRQPTAFYGLVINTDGVNNITLTVWDTNVNDPVGTNITIEDSVIVADSENVHLIFDPPIFCNKGIYVEIESAGTFTYKVLYDTDTVEEVVLPIPDTPAMLSNVMYTLYGGA